jgi:DNA transposition AAA+ family ATPase
MNEQTNAMAATWALPISLPDVTGNRAGRTAADLKDWQELTAKVAEIAIQNGWSKAEVSRRSGVPDGTFNQWFSGKYAGRLDETNNRVRQWLDAVQEMSALGAGIPQSPPFIMTRTAKEIVETLTYAQMMPEMAIVCLGAGVGKTIACRAYCATRPHAYHVTMSPNTKTVHGMLTEIATTFGISQHNPARLHRSIGERLQRNGRKTLLIVDEAQNLVDSAVDQLRNLLDVNECGIVLSGNQEIYGRFSARSDGPSYAQIKRRIGKRLKRLTPYPEDITAFIDAWGIADPSARKLLVGIGNKPGALGQIDKTLKLAGLLAAGEGTAIGEKHIRAAWSNRSVED